MNNNLEDIDVNISAGKNKIKYYECDNINCKFEILNNNKKCCEENIISQEIIESKNIKKQNFILNKIVVNEVENIKEKNEEVLYKIKGKEEQTAGQIIVTSILDCDEHQCLEGVKINLYKINGLSPILIDSKVTDEDGKVIFSKVENGSYRIIELVDKRYFQKPKYKKWNEITIDSNNKTYEILVINKVKQFVVK